MGDLEAVDRCPICHGDSQTPVLEQPDALFPGGVLLLVRCDECGAVFLNPRVTSEKMRRLEDDSEVYDFSPDDVEREVRARRGLIRTIGGFGYGYKTLLDVGCNRGFLLAAARRLGWRPVGVELSPVAARQARALAHAPVYEELGAVRRPRRGFDLVIAWHVLEHTQDPVGVLGKIAGLVRRKGTIAVQVPSFDYVDRFREQGRTGSIVCAVHNFCFDEVAFREVARRAGLDIRRLTNNASDLMLTALMSRSAPAA